MYHCQSSAGRLFRSKVNTDIKKISKDELCNYTRTAMYYFRLHCTDALMHIVGPGNVRLYRCHW